MVVATVLLYLLFFLGAIILTVLLILLENKNQNLDSKIRRLDERIAFLESNPFGATFTPGSDTLSEKAKYQKEKNASSASKPIPVTLTQKEESPYNSGYSENNEFFQPDNNPNHNPDNNEETQQNTGSEKNADTEENNHRAKTESPNAKKKPEIKIPLLARPFLEGLQKNWIGIIGTAFFVLGFGFLGLYPSAQIAGLKKFILFAICSSAIFITTYFTAKSENWKNLSLWMRSGASAIFLFACVGSYIIPGFIWVEDTLTMIILLITGIAVNLFAGYSGKTQLIALVHILFSLIALSVVEATPITLFIGLLVSCFGIFLCFQKKWDVGLLVALSEFFIFHLYWHSKLPDEALASELWGLLAVFLILVAALLVHYRKQYSDKKFQPLPFITHFLNWFFFAIGLIIYFEIIPSRSNLFLIVGLATYLISRKGKNLNIRWLYVTDALAGYFLIFTGILSTELAALNPFMITAILFAEALIFLFVVSAEKESILVSIGYFFTLILGFALIIVYTVAVIFEVGDSIDSETIVPHLNSIIYLGVILAAGTVYYLSLQKGDTLFSRFDKKLDSVIAVLFGLMLTALFYRFFDRIWGLWGILILSGPLLYLRHRYKPMGNSIGLMILLIGISVGSWVMLGTGKIIDWESAKEIIPYTLFRAGYILPLFIGIIAAIKLSGVADFSAPVAKMSKGKVKRVSKASHINKNGFTFVAGTINYLIVTYFLFRDISSLLPGIVWLVTIPLLLETAHFLQTSNRFKIRTERYFLIPDQIRNINHIIFASFFIRHLFVHLPSKIIWGPEHARLFIGLAAIAVIIYWMIRNRSEKIEKRFLLDKISRVLLEVLYLFILLTAAVELKASVLPGFWIATGIVTMILSLKIEKIPSRMRLYSLFWGWLSFFHLAFVNSAVTIADYRGLPVKWISGGITFALQIVFLILVKKIDPLNYVLFGRKNALPKTIRKHINKWAFFPFFAAIAIYIWVSFDKSVITLSLIVESLGIFILSLALKENSFRYLSLLAIGGCLFRLVFVDLFNSDMFIKALVFIGVGVAMLLMNTLYLKFGKVKVNPNEETGI